MADPNFKKISDMAALTTAAADDIIPIVDVSEAADADKNKKITTANLRKNITNAELAGSITAAKIAGISSDPNADRIVFWDDSATSLAYLAPSTGLQVTDTSITTKDSEIVHDNLSGFVADEHVAHSGVTITAGAGLSGGGTIAASRTIDLDHLGIEDLTDPGADRIAFWDDSASAMKWLSPGSGLAIAGTTLNAADIGSGDIADGAVTPAKTSFFGNGDDVVTYFGVIQDNGTALCLPSGWSSVLDQTGQYTITHNFGVSTNKYGVICQNESTAGSLISPALSNNSFVVRIFRHYDAAPISVKFSFMVVKYS